MTQAVIAAADVVAGLNAVAGALGAWLWWRGDPTGGPARFFWFALRFGQGSAVAFAIAVGSLAATGHTAPESLFYLYALLPLAVGFVAEQLRVVSAQTILDQRGLADSAAVGRLPDEEQTELVSAILGREIGVMALSALVVVFLALRAGATAHGI